jgi:NADPH2:quinone reductase
VGVFWGEFAKREPGRNARMLGELAAWYAAGKVKPVLDRVLPMEELPAAFAHGGTRGGRQVGSYQSLKPETGA